MGMRGFLLALLLLMAGAVGALAAGKVALVIGNGAYQNANVLPNPTNDANDMSAKLKELGFEVFGGSDLTFEDMGTRIGEFEDAARDADVTLLFYAGHGMQVNGRNYLIPIDAKLERESSLKFQTIDAEDVLRAMSGPGKTSIALLDACRDNPLSRRFSRSLGSNRSNAVQQGLAVPNITGGGMLIGFATAPGDVAADGDGRNSPFTTALLKHMSTPGLEIQQLMTRVKREVYNTTKENQEPWHNSSLRDEIYLGGEAAKIDTPKVEADNTTVSQEWNLVKDTTSMLVLEAFIAAYADKPLFVALAQERMEALLATKQALQAKADDARTTAEKQALAATEAVAAEQQARLEEIERQRVELDKSEAALASAKAEVAAREAEKQVVRDEALKLKADQEAALAEIARQKAEISKTMELLEAQLKAKQPEQVAKLDAPAPLPIPPAPGEQAITQSPPPIDAGKDSDVGKDSFLNFFFGNGEQAPTLPDTVAGDDNTLQLPPPQGSEELVATPPSIDGDANTQLALNNDPPAAPAAAENPLFDGYLRAAIAANQNDLSLIYAVGNVMVLPRPDQNPGSKTRTMAAKRIASAASMEDLLRDNPDLAFLPTALWSCQIGQCRELPKQLKDKIEVRYNAVVKSLPGGFSGLQDYDGRFFAQPLVGYDRYIISNSRFLVDDKTPAVLVMAVVDLDLNVEAVFSLALPKSATGLEADPRFGNIKLTWAARDGDDVIISFDSSSRCDDKPRRMGLLLRFGLNDQKIKWVSPFNVSNTNFILTDRHIYAADGGSCQEDHVYQLDKETGKILSRFRVKTSADDLWMDGKNLVLQLYEGAEAWQLK